MAFATCLAAKALHTCLGKRDTSTRSATEICLALKDATGGARDHVFREKVYVVSAIGAATNPDPKNMGQLAATSRSILRPVAAQ